MKTFAYVISVTVDVTEGFEDEVKASEVAKHVRHVLNNELGHMNFEVTKATVIPIREDTTE